MEPRIAAASAELLGTGRWQQLERLRGSADPQALVTAARIEPAQRCAPARR